MEDTLREVCVTTDHWRWWRSLNPCSSGRYSARSVRRKYILAWNEVLILVLVEDTLRELILRHTERQLVTALFLENPLDFRGKSVPNCPQIY